VDEADPVFLASAAGTITTAKIANWDEAHGWGNHALAGYLTGIGGLTSWTGLSDTPATFTADKFIKVNAGATALEFIDDPGLPTQTGHAGKILATDGTTASWVDESTINTSHTTAAAAAKKALIYAIIFGG
jgi:hypothetical protein